jgi:hypothetical protein
MSSSFRIIYIYIFFLDDSILQEVLVFVNLLHTTIIPTTVSMYRYVSVKQLFNRFSMSFVSPLSLFVSLSVSHTLSLSLFTT